MAISLIPFDRLIFGLCAAPKMAPRLVHQIWGSHSDAVSQLLVREVIVAEQVEVLPGNRRATGTAVLCRDVRKDLSRRARMADSRVPKSRFYTKNSGRCRPRACRNYFRRCLTRRRPATATD